MPGSLILTLPIAVIAICLMLFSVISILSVPRNQRVKALEHLIRPWLFRR